jgi:hypothetical protein
MNYQCPVCFYSGLPYPPADYHICPCCGTEFGQDDDNYSHAQLREMWVATGAHWFFGKPPLSWNPWLQLIEGGLSGAAATGVIKVVVQFGTAKSENLEVEDLNFSGALVSRIGTGAYAATH